LAPLRSHWGIGLALAGAVLCGCRSDPPRSGIAVLIESPPDSLDERLALTTAGQRIAQLITPGLITFDDQGQPIPDLAASYRPLDAQTIEFTLRSGLTFHDGAPLTSADVKATFEGISDPLLASPKVEKFEAIASIEAVDPLTARVHLKRAYSPILAELSGLGIVPTSRARGPAARLQDRAPIGAGPFRIVGQPDEELIELLPFDGYYGGKPRISKLTLRTVRDQTTRVLELLKGRADLVLGSLSPAVFPSLQSNPALRVLARPGSAYAYLGLNVRQGPLADVRVRRAICHAIDVRPIIEAKFHGLAEPATGMLPKDHWAYAPTPGCQRDLQLAAKLLDEAGYQSAGAAVDLRKPRLHLSLKTSTDRFRKSIALIFQQQLAEAGIEVELRTLESGTFFNDVRKGNFELFSLVWSSVIEPDLMRWAFSIRNVPGPENNFGGLNRTGYGNPRLEPMLEEAARVPRQERKRIYAQALAILDADLPYIPLWHESSPAVVSSRLQDFEPSAHGFFRPLGRAREAMP
jgi:peptide/nickel transport system substrate-binding protein